MNKAATTNAPTAGNVKSNKAERAGKAEADWFLAEALRKSSSPLEVKDDRESAHTAQVSQAAARGPIPPIPRVPGPVLLPLLPEYYSTGRPSLKGYDNRYGWLLPELPSQISEGSTLGGQVSWHPRCPQTTFKLICPTPPETFTSRLTSESP